MADLNCPSSDHEVCFGANNQRFLPRTAEEEASSSRKLDSRLWIEKHAPRNVGELAVHKKKVEDVNIWLKDQILHYSEHCQMQETCVGSRVLLLTGPTGGGKTALVHVLARELGCQLCEWKASVPTLWNEFQHMGSAGPLYASKFDEFEEFLKQAEKFPMLHLEVWNARAEDSTGSEWVAAHHRKSGSQNRECKGPKLLLIDDLPLAHDADRQRRVAGALYGLACGSRFPTIVILTNSIVSHQSCGNFANIMYEQALRRGGAGKISLNPLTSIAICRVLSRVALAEECRVSPEEVAAISECSAGDIRNAVLTLQFQCGGGPKLSLLLNARHLLQPVIARVASGKKRKHAARQPNVRTRNIAAKVDDCGIGECTSHITAGQQRDGVLSLFHAIGKLLHNKRIHKSLLDGDESFGEAFRRRQLSMETPEEILMKSHADPGTATAFLHENMLNFMDEDAIQDTAAALRYLSDVDVLLQGRRFSAACDGPASQYAEPEQSRIALVAAGSVAARGILFANVHSVQTRWQAMRAPTCRQLDRSRAAAMAASLHRAWIHERCMPWCFLGATVYLTELQPFRERLNGLQGEVLTSWPQARVGKKKVDIIDIDGVLLSKGEDSPIPEADSEAQDVRVENEPVSSQGLQDSEWDCENDIVFVEEGPLLGAHHEQMELVAAEDEIEDWD